jgi:multicomponent Na+:H+ antiporter subunit G
MSVIILLLYAAGLFFNLSAVVGILRLPDLYCRLHSSSKNTTLGSLLIVFGLALQWFTMAENPAAIKVLLIGAFFLIITPIGSHALARAAYKYGVPLWEGSVCDQYADSTLLEGEGVAADV